MTDIAAATIAAQDDAYGRLIEPTTLEIRRLLPGPIDRVWSYLTDANLRRQWLADGAMELRADAPFELTWRNDELTDPPGNRPEDFGTEHRMASRILEVEPPHKLVFTWGSEGGSVAFTLAPAGDKVLLTVVHKRLAARSARLMVSAGWHAHLDILATRLTGGQPTHFWDKWARLKDDYDARLPR